MSSVKSKYLKDESGNIISPVTSASSVYVNWTPSNSFETVESRLAWTYLGRGGISGQSITGSSGWWYKYAEFLLCACYSGNGGCRVMASIIIPENLASDSMTASTEPFTHQARYEENGTIIKAGVRFVSDTTINVIGEGHCYATLYGK